MVDERITLVIPVTSDRYRVTMHCKSSRCGVSEIKSLITKVREMSEALPSAVTEVDSVFY